MRIPTADICVIDLRNVVHSRLVEQSKLGNESSNRPRCIGTTRPSKEVDFILRMSVVIVCEKSVSRPNVVFQPNSECTFQRRYIFAFGFEEGQTRKVLDRVEG